MKWFFSFFTWTVGDYHEEVWGKLRGCDICLWEELPLQNKPNDWNIIFVSRIKSSSEKEILQLSYSENIVNIWQLSLLGNGWHFSKCSKTADWSSLWKKKNHFALPSSIWTSSVLKSYSPHHPFRSQDMNVSLGTSPQLELKKWLADSRVLVGRGAVSGFPGNSSLCTNDQSHLELPGLKSTFTYLSQQGGFEKAVVGHKQTKLIRWQLILDL